ncbi:MAG: oligosaccharide flippase family protein [Candidatus Marinimicrobia bacterium]|jgi:O-antigen/teichoic acid export membrane protein|nr:oligosaccharide flippase family protein [Candidatus Neomarinimicrobiota bacterium]MBT5225362.1 oligosaccharide flippase family protein [Candidatus Neomarinimicrobiota bacterium]MBT6980865.1 oligosaccharide flippase family protein [Candidatus Neomarinimicrobiota bacterium]MBT7119435.1 oligosaccharide flippase family protein [Candidatus Neomarinimicrobiota bacterium]MBT7518958.1 oligosaccharide flippase family protein [Candidatus Neomarinimicrobiota bacterium]
MLINNIRYSTITTVSRLVSGFFLIFILARLLTLSAFGILTYSIVFANLLVLIIEYGYELKLSKDTARNLNDIGILTWRAVKVKLLLLIFVIIILFILGIFSYPDPTTYKIIFILCISSVFNSFAKHFLIPYRSVDRFDVEAKYVFINNILLFWVVALIAYSSRNITAIALGFLCVKIIYSTLTVRKFISDFGFKFDTVNLFDELKQTFPYAVHIAVGALYLNIDTIILRAFVSNSEIGIYQAGMRAMAATTIGLGILNSVLIPKLSSLVDKSKDQLIELSTKFNLVAFILGVLIAFIVNIFSNELIYLVYGEKFSTLSNYVIYFSIIIFLRYFGVVYGALLTISDKQKIRTYGVLFTLLFIIVVDLFVIPTYELYGALYTLIASHIILNTIYFYFAYKEYRTSFFNIAYVK